MIGEIKLTISSDMMSVTAAIVDGSSEITEDYVLSKLRDAGVGMGINHDRIAELVEYGIKNYALVVAEGKPAGETEPGYFEYFIDISHKNEKTTIDEKGNVSYSKNRILVYKGQKLVEYHRSVSGAFGYTVMSAVVAPKPVKDYVMKCGPGVEQVESTFIATVDGEVILEDDKISVSDILVINGDARFGVDTNTNFLGNVHITGDVLSGVTITAKGTIEIDGFVEACNISSDKNVIIHGGIHGDQKAVIRAGDTITCAFVEEATLYAGSSIQVDYVINSRLNAQSIVVHGKRGLVIGGVAKASHSIEADEVGNEAGISTRLEIVNDDRLSVSKSKVIINNGVHDGIKMSVNGVDYRLLPKAGQEYHLVNHSVVAFGIGEYKQSNVGIQTEEFGRKTILLVDDEPMILKNLYGFLADKYDVLLTNSAKDALTLLDKNPKVPDLMLLDYMMPGMDGAELLSTIRSNTWKLYTNVPVFFVTAIADKESIAKCLRLYPQGYLVKPIGKNELLNAIDKYFNG